MKKTRERVVFYRFRRVYLFSKVFLEKQLTKKTRVDILIHVAEAHAKRERHRRKKLRKSN